MSDQSGLEQTYGERYAASLMNTFGAPKLVLTRGEGPYVWDADGRRYLDLLGGIAVNALGHGHPALVDAVTTQLSTLGHISNFFTSAPQVELAEALVRLLDADAPAKVFFTNSGTEANEAAFKLTRRTGRTRIVAAEGAFHGRTMGALALTAKAAYREPFEPLPGEVVFVPYGDAEALAAAVDDTTAAIVLEPIQGEAGVVVPPEGYLAAARRIADEHGALLWFDEIQSGMGRTGHWFAHQHPAIGGVTPDVVTLAKSLGGGFPIGALIGIGRAAELFEPGNHGTTFGGNPVACAAGLAVIGVIENAGLLERVAVLGQKIRDGLAADPRVVEVRGEGLLIGLDLVAESSAAVAAAAQDAGFIVNAPTPTRIRLAPAYVLTEDDVDSFLAAWPGILDAAGVTA
ncbi:acetylornithine transaminase [Nocardioides fonticola]|uniref:Acetylornithine aminotransferase n=1 Tax=Nocardioides fonticola TaxID=450363 RepID=A0ABP7XY97_9ACTN